MTGVHRLTDGWATRAGVTRGHRANGLTDFPGNSWSLPSALPSRHRGFSGTAWSRPGDHRQRVPSPRTIVADVRRVCCGTLGRHLGQVRGSVGGVFARNEL